MRAASSSITGTVRRLARSPDRHDLLPEERRPEGQGIVWSAVARNQYSESRPGVSVVAPPAVSAHLATHATCHEPLKCMKHAMVSYLRNGATVHIA